MIRKTIICITTFAMLFSFAGCGKQPVVAEEPTTVVEEPVVEDPSEEELVEEKPEESNEPEIVLYDENGDYYVPQHVTIDQFYERIDYANKKYEWKSDWDRDRFVGLLLYNNANYMDDEDIKTIYYDYLDNFGIGVLDSQHAEHTIYAEEMQHDEYYDFHSIVDLEDLFIDPRLSLEAKKYQAVASDLRVRADFLKRKNAQMQLLDYTNYEMYNVLFELEMWDFMYSFGEKCSNGVFENAHAIDDSKFKIWNLIDFENEKLNYQITDYQSSHKKTES